MPENSEEKNITVNRKANHEYSIYNTYETGIVLQGTEVKSIRQGKINLLDSYGVIKNGEVWLINCHISNYEHGNINNHDPLRDRKLLLNRNEIRKLNVKVKEKGLTLVPLRVFIKNGLVKIELAVAKGKKVYDKRSDIAKKDFKREQERKIKY
jgi:SsrA-binding protein